MNLHKKIIEDAAGGAVGATAVAAMATPLMASCAKRYLPPEPKIIKIGRRVKKAKDLYHAVSLKETFNALFELDGSKQPTAPNSNDNTDPAEVTAKLKGLENKEKVDRHDTTVFGLEDDKGKIVRITVRTDQAPAFEQTLQSYLADYERDQGEKGAPEVAEIIFKLKDRFDIVDVDFPDVEEDEEEDMTLPNQQDPQGGDAGAEGEVDPNAPPADDMGDLGGGGEDDAKSMLMQVIDMMKADAEARKADAHARTAEAKAREADLGKKTAYAKVKHEEELLDMEAHEKSRKAEEKEAKQLAKLAKWKHEMSDNEGASFSDDNEDEEESNNHIENLIRQAGENKPKRVAKVEDEESSGSMGAGDVATAPAPIAKRKQLSGRVSPGDVANFILSRV